MSTATMSATSRPSSTLSFIAIALFVVVFLSAIFYVKPLFDDVSALSQGRDEKTNEKTQLSAELQNLQNIQQSVGQSTEVTRQTALHSIPQRLEQDKLIGDLTTISKSNDIILNSVNFSVNTSGTGKVKHSTVNANLTGNFDGLLGFLRGVESNARKLKVNSVSVQTGSTDTGIPRVNFNVNMETYYLERL